MGRSDKFYKRYLKTLQAAHSHPKELKRLIEEAPIPVIKLLSNAAIVASRGNIKLTPAQKRAFGQKRDLFAVLASRKVPLDQKRHYLVQSGGSLVSFIPLLLSTVLPLAGDLLFRLFQKK